ncbi:unnamed protein product, partial [Adineta ricciae]
STEREIPLPEEETVQFNKDDVVLDFYTSDLNLTINTDCLSASNKSNDALCFLWAGVHGTYGFRQGRIGYEIRITEIIDCPQMPESEKEKFGVRVGWSNLSSNLQLGEFNGSFAYTSTGKKLSMANDQVVEDTYGESFGVSDVIASYIDFGDDSDSSSIRIYFTKNGTDFGPAFEFSKNDSKEFYPHILVKNVRFECNFGQLETSWSEVKPNYTFAQNIPVSDRIRGSTPVEEKSQCQVVLLSGLNGSGKTSWAKKYMEENSDKHFNLLNAEHVLNKMTIDGKLPVIKDRNDGLMIRVNIALQRLIEVAARRRRNFIIDHTNTARESQVKRQRLFTGYHRIGVVIVPDDDELKKRIEKVEKTENITFPSYWIRDAKAKFYFPQTSSSLEEIIYPELSYDDAKLLYDKARQDYEQYRSSSRYDRRDDYYSSRNNNNTNNNRNRYDDRDRRSREHDRNRDRAYRSRSRSRDRDRRTSSREDSRFSSSSSSSHRNENYRGGYSRGGDGRYSDHRQDSRNNQRGGFHDSRGSGGYRGRGGNYNNQSNDDRRGGYQQQQHQRNDFGGGRGRGGGSFDNNRGSYHDRQRGGFRQDYSNQPRGRSFNDYDNNLQRQQGGGGGGGRNFMQNNNNNNFNQQHDRQRFDSRSSMQQQGSFHNQQQPQRSGPLLQNPPSNQQQQQQSYSSHLTQQTANNPNLSLQTQNSLNLNALSNAANMTQQNSLDPWLALCAAALNTQSTVSQQQQHQQQQHQQQQHQQPQQDANSLTQQWAQWLKSTQMAQTAQQSQPQLTVQSNDSQQAQLSDASALYYQAYYAQLAAAQQQAAAAAAAAAAGPFNGGVAPPGANDK